MSSAISDILKMKLDPGAMRNKTKITYSYSISMRFPLFFFSLILQAKLKSRTSEIAYCINCRSTVFVAIFSLPSGKESQFFPCLLKQG